MILIYSSTLVEISRIWSVNIFGTGEIYEQVQRMLAKWSELLSDKDILMNFDSVLFVQIPIGRIFSFWLQICVNAKIGQGNASDSSMRQQYILNNAAKIIPNVHYFRCIHLSVISNRNILFNNIFYPKMVGYNGTIAFRHYGIRDVLMLQ